MGAGSDCALHSAQPGGQLGTYVGAVRGLPFVLGIGNLLPPAFANCIRGTARHISRFCSWVALRMLLVVSQLGGAFRAAYQMTVDMSVITLVHPVPVHLSQPPGSSDRRIAAICGLVVSVLAIVLSFHPTSDVHSVPWFETKLIGGCVLLFALGRVCYRHKYQVAVAAQRP